MVVREWAMGSGEGSRIWGWMECVNWGEKVERSLFGLHNTMWLLW